MKVIKIILVGLLYVALSTNGAAQKSDKQKENKKAQREMVEQLELTKEQQKSLKVINKDYHTKTQALKADKTIADADKRLRKRALKKERQTEIQAVLTDSQYAKLQELKVEKHEKKKSNKGDKLKADLGLSDGQSDEIEAVHQKYQPLIRAIKEDKSLSEGERKTQSKALKTQKKDEIKTILTDEQYAKWVELKKQNKKKK